ncbi:anhydro-N-acetylmuramic acid kinase [Ferruginibacter sp. HRS2-29]|uniref:anhydro-N-acetylmuramic acid kinase n=1 Tax=Ferruginibacter sp. HRS2-29 TaxID=2487334 RepID=UPI0020CBF610|nr:anhydro-N-acetylmuramic acid kinase [Ferruginibacter sp. HRS2-29]MCP9752268.1 anhydro-N-acetylmuramic acid kinase [Ferruginibacter sp. HRS2-29]
MNAQIEKLYAIAGKKKRHILGLMSGTSLDGLDVALCEIEGSGASTRLILKNFSTKNYSATFKARVREVFSQRQADLQTICLLNEWLGEKHAEIVNHCLEEWGVKKEEVDLIASHGQTIYHAPKHLHPQDEFGNGTLQIGDGDHIAVKTGIITISDFRQKHIAAGGEGAPLAAYGDYLLFKEKDTNVILLNIGGIANLTYLPIEGHMFSTDIGPGNTLMDAWMQQNFSMFSFDENAFIARAGNIHDGLLSALKENDFFKLPFPKTTGPELFSLDYLYAAQKKSGTSSISINDTMATLNKFTADAICDAINQLSSRKGKTKVYVSGGGMHNILLMEHLIKNIRNATIDSTAEKNIHPDAKEAILFAILANECVAGNADSFVSGIKNFPAIAMGKISFPN